MEICRTGTGSTKAPSVMAPWPPLLSRASAPSLTAAGALLEIALASRRQLYAPRAPVVLHPPIRAFGERLVITHLPQTQIGVSEGGRGGVIS